MFGNGALLFCASGGFAAFGSPDKRRPPGAESQTGGRRHVRLWLSFATMPVLVHSRETGNCAASASSEEQELEREIHTLVSRLAPQLLTEPGVGPISAAELVISWWHPGPRPNRSRLRPPDPEPPVPHASGYLHTWSQPGYSICVLFGHDNRAIGVPRGASTQVRAAQATV
jgi:hypothetical protein